MLGRLPYLKNLRIYSRKITRLLWSKKKHKLFTFKRQLLISLGIVLGSCLIGWFLLYGNQASAAWYSDNWGYRRKITIDNTKVSGSTNLTNFPVLISFTSDTSLSDNANSDGSDIVFVDSSGNKLSHEIEYYSSGTLSAWVKIASLSPSTDTTIYMYYGNPSTSSQQNVTSVWASDYRGVWHLSETSGQHQDSTSNNNDSTTVNVTTQGSATGKIGGADDFATGNEVIVADSNSLDISGSFTAQAWVKADTIGGSGTWNSIIYKGGNSNYFLELTNTDEIDAGFYGGGDWRSLMTTTDVVSTGAFYHLAVVHDASADTIKIYVNGVEKGTVSSITQTPLANTSTFTIGENFYNETFDGIIDEVRLSDSPKSVDWLLTEYNNQNSPSTFYSAGHEEVRKRGPAAQWRFDEGYGTSVNDSTGNAVVGSMGTGSSAPAWTGEDLCISGKCIQMDGSDDFLSFGDTLDVEDGEDFTFSAWIKSNSFSTVQTVLAKKLGNSSGQVGYLINIGTGGTLNFYAADGTDQIWKGSSTAMSPNTWYHVAFVFDEDNASNIAFYINGTPTSGNLTGTLANVNSLANPQVLGLGVEPDGQYVFNGFIDEAKFYSYARTADEIKQDYLFASAKGAAAVLGTQDSAFLSEGLVGYWKMDETIGSTGPSWTATDSSGNGNNGAGAGDAGPRAGKFGNGGTFDGTGDQIMVSDSSSLDIESNATWSVWFKLDSLPSVAGNSYRLLDKWVGTGNQRSYQLYIATTNKLHMDIDPDGTDVLDVDVAGNSALVVDTWYHVVVVADGSQSYMYVNGVKQDDIENLSSIYSSTSNLYIGSDTSSNYFDGTMDELRIYNRALSPSEVKSLYEWTPGPVAHWSMDAAPTYASTISSRINASSDDGEDPVSGGAVDLTSSDLELVVDGSIDQEVGMLFDNIYIPQGTTITNATIQFTVDETDSGTTNLTFYGDDTDNSSTFTTTAGNIRNRTKTSASVNWNSVPAWSIVGEAGTNQKTPDLSSIIQEIVNRSGWSSGNSLAIIVDGTGERTAESYDGSSSDAPLLTITCSPYCNSNAITSLSDISGNNNTGTFYGSINTNSFVPGKYGKALDFNGDNDVVVVADGEDVNFNGGSFTISTWFKADDLPSNTSGADMLLAKANDSGSADARGWEFILDDSTDKVRARLWDNVSDVGSSDGDAYSDNAIAVNTWYHAAMVYTADIQELSLYINGVKQQSTATVESSDYAKDLTIGAYNSSGIHSFDGQIDDVKIYKYARSQAQILGDINAGHPVIGTPVGSSVLQFGFDEGYGTTVHDKSPEENNGTLGTGSSAPTWTNDGKFGKALSFNGNDYITIPDSDTYTFGNGTTDSAFSVSAWINTTDATQGSIVGKYDETSGDQKREFLLYLSSSDYLTFLIEDETAGGYISRRWNAPFPENTWHHVVAVYDGSGVESGIKVYVDGVRKDDTSSSSGSFNAIQNTTSSIEIGANSNSATGKTYFFDGTIDEVAIYPFALTSDQISTVMNGGKTLVLGAKSTGVGGTAPSNSASREYCIPGDTTYCAAPVGEWKLDEKTGTTAYDTSGNNFNGTLTNNPTWTTGKFGSGINTDGADQHINITDPAGGELDFNGTDNGTFMAWVRSTTASSDTFLYKGFGGGDPGYRIRVASDGDAVCGVADNAAGTTEVTANNSAIADGQWHHVACVIGGSGTTLSIYVDGQYQGIVSDAEGSLESAKDLNIGLNSGSSYWPGDIDEVRIYKYARTAAQIAWDYNRGAPIAWYKFDECQGTTTYNAALNSHGKAAGNNGTITIGGSDTSSVGNCSTSSTAWGNGASGKINASLSFDGTDDYVDMGDPSSGIFDPGTGDFSISLWMKGGTQSNTLSRLVFKYQAIHLNANHTTICSNKISFEKPSGNSGVCSTTSVNTNTWYHVTAVRQGDTAKMYINGVLEGTQTGWASENATTNYSLTIGGYPSANHYFNGQIDDVRIFRYALTSDQVKQAYTNGAVSFK